MIFKREKHTYSVKRNVLQVKQSPLNPLRWMLVLECGHDTWVTAKRRPQRKTSHCAACPQAGFR